MQMRPTPDSDKALLDRWQRHADAEAFTEIVQRYSGMVYGVSRRVLGSDADAQDAVQESFLKLGRAKSLRSSSVASLLHTIAVRCALSRRTSEQRRAAREVEYAQHQRAEHMPEFDDVARYVDEAIAQLPEALRQPLVARYLAGETHSAIAERMGIDESTVRYRIQRALEQAREQLAKRRITSSAGGLVALFTAESAKAAPAVLVHRLGVVAIAGTSASAAPVAAGIGSIIMGKKIAVGVGIAACMLGGIAFVTHDSTRWPWNERESAGGPPVADDSAPLTAAEPVQTVDKVVHAGAENAAMEPELSATATRVDRRDRTRPVTLPTTLAELRERAGAAEDGTPDVEPIKSSDVPRDNGAHYFLLASELLSDEDAAEIGDLYERFEAGDATPEEILEALAEYRDVLAAVREGVALENAMLPRPTHGPHELLPYLNEWRHMSRLLVMESHVLAEQGLVEASLRSLDTAIAFANDSSRGGTLVGGLVSYAITSFAMDTVRERVTSGALSPAQYEGLIQRMTELEANAPYSQEMQLYDADGMDSWIVEQMREGRTLRDMLRNEDWGTETMVNLPEGDLGEYVDGFFEVRQAIIEYSARPYWEMEQAEVDALVGSNPLSDALFPAVMRVAEAEARNTARLRGMAIVSAVEWYAQEHGVYPETLDALAPGYLPSVPQDPFSGRPFPYFVDANGYTVYAAGGDRTDNGGAPGAPSDDGSDLIIHRPDTP